MPENSKESGFSLIEVAIALLVISIVMVPILYAFNQYVSERRKIITTGSVASVNSALLKFYEKNGFYPRPSQPNIAEGAVGFGAPAAPAVWPACTAASTTVCETNNLLYGVNGDILIGGVPHSALGIPYTLSLDGYGRKLSYAVSERLTAIATFDDSGGAIEVNRQNNTSFFGILSQPRGHFAVYSHGQDGRGAFTLSGTKPIACGNDADSDDFENCNNDSLFKNNTSAAGITQVFEAAGAAKFDDFLTTVSSSGQGFWAYTAAAQDVVSKTTGNVRIGPAGVCPGPTCFPSSRVDVSGSVQAPTIETTRICRSNENDCTSNLIASTPRETANSNAGPAVGWFSPSMLTGAGVAVPVAPVVADPATEGYIGAGIRCYNGYALKGVRSYDEVCAGTASAGPTSTPHLSAVASVTNCAVAGTYAVGITINAAGTGFTFNCAPP